MNKQSEKPRGLLSGKTVLLCVTGGIAAYKMPKCSAHVEEACVQRTCSDDAECHEFYHSDDV